MAYGKSRDLAERTQSDKVLRDKAFKIAGDPKYDGYQEISKFLIKELVEVMLTLNQVINLQIKFIGRLLKKVTEEKFIHLLETMFEVLL